MAMDTDNPLVSVILPTYNRGYIIERAIKSVLNQTYKNLELIIVDDGSTDNTEEIVKSIEDKRIIFLKHKKNKGASSARNTGIKNSKGEYISFIDSDDVWFPLKLEKQINIFRKISDEYGVVFSSFFYIRYDGQKLILPGHFSEKKLKNIMERFNIVNLSSSLIKKEYILESGLFDERFPRLQDWEFFFRLTKVCLFKFIKEPLLEVYVQRDGISSNTYFLIEGLHLFIEKYKNSLSKSSISALYRRLGVLEYVYGDKKRGLGNVLESLRYSPFSIKSITTLFLFFSGKKLFRKIMGV